MKTYIFIALLTVVGIILTAKFLGGVPEIKQSDVKMEAKTEVVKAITQAPSAKPTTKANQLGNKAIDTKPTNATSPTPQPTVVIQGVNQQKSTVECPLSADGTNTMTVEKCNILIFEYNEAKRKEYDKRLEEYNAKLQEYKLQYQADQEAYEAKRKELYEACINQPLETHANTAGFVQPYYPYGNAGQKTTNAAQIIEDCKKLYGFE